MCVPGTQAARRNSGPARVHLHIGCQEEVSQAQGVRKWMLQAWVSGSGGRTTACDPHTLGGDLGGDQRGPDLKHSTTKQLACTVPCGGRSTNGCVWVAAAGVRPAGLGGRRCDVLSVLCAEQIHSFILGEPCYSIARKVQAGSS